MRSSNLCDPRAMNHPQKAWLSMLDCQLSSGKRAFFMVFTQEHSVCLGLQRKTIYQQLFLAQPLYDTLSFWLWQEGECRAVGTDNAMLPVMGCFLNSSSSLSKLWQMGSCWSKQTEFFFFTLYLLLYTFLRRKRVWKCLLWEPSAFPGSSCRLQLPLSCSLRSGPLQDATLCPTVATQQFI